MGHAPVPAPPVNWARNTTTLLSVQINQENTCGFVRPSWIERMYGTYIAIVSAIAAAAKTLFTIRNTTWASLPASSNTIELRRLKLADARVVHDAPIRRSAVANDSYAGTLRTVRGVIRIEVAVDITRVRIY